VILSTKKKRQTLGIPREKGSNRFGHLVSTKDEGEQMASDGDNFKGVKIWVQRIQVANQGEGEKKSRGNELGTAGEKSDLIFNKGKAAWYRI